MVNFELYKVFYIAAKERSISKAAAQLYITQPAVSQSIRQLEDKLGGKLFFRTPRGIIPTHEGEVLFRYIEQAYNIIMTAEYKFGEMQNLLAGSINIGASDMTCKYYLLPYLEEFHQLFPGVKLHVTNGPTPETIDQLKKGFIDFGVVSLPLKKDSRLQIKECMTIQDCFVAGAKYRELSVRELEFKELENYPVLMLEKHTSTRKYLDDFFVKQGIDITPEIELATSDLLVQFAKRGLGIACVVRNFAEEEFGKLNLFEIRFKQAIPSRKIGVVTLRDVPVSAAAGRFLSLLGDCD